METKEKIKAPVADELEQFLEDYSRSLQAHSRQLKDALDVIMHSNGKHIRPLLVILTAKACGNVSTNTVNSAVLLELLHTATLIHDDVVDETKLRRGVPSLNAIFDNRIAVLVGDFVLSTALVRSFLTGDIRIVGIISQLGRSLSEGEIMQLETAEDHIIDKKRYLEVIGQKTATLLAACTEIGALSANANDKMVQICRSFGKKLGYAFQIRDDIFDYFEDENIGKPTGNDIREGKVTLPLLYALQTAESHVADKYLDIIKSSDFTDENVSSLIAFTKEYKGIEYATSVMNDYRDKALEIIQLLPDSEAKESLLLLANDIVERDK